MRFRLRIAPLELDGGWTVGDELRDLRRDGLFEVTSVRPGAAVATISISFRVCHPCEAAISEAMRCS